MSTFDNSKSKEGARELREQLTIVIPVGERRVVKRAVTRAALVGTNVLD
jgi:hypothetical protein